MYLLIHFNAVEPFYPENQVNIENTHGSGPGQTCLGVNHEAALLREFRIKQKG